MFKACCNFTKIYYNTLFFPHPFYLKLNIARLRSSIVATPQVGAHCSHPHCGPPPQRGGTSLNRLPGSHVSCLISPLARFFKRLQPLNFSHFLLLSSEKLQGNPWLLPFFFEAKELSAASFRCKLAQVQLLREFKTRVQLHLGSAKKRSPFDATQTILQI